MTEPIKILTDIPGALVGFAEFMKSRGMDIDHTPGMTVERKGQRLTAVYMTPALDTLWDDYMAHKTYRSWYN